MTDKPRKIQKSLVVPTRSHSNRLDIALTKLLPQYSRNQIQNWIENAYVKVNGKIAKAKNKVKENDNIELDVSLPPLPAWEAEAIPLKIIFEDDEMIIIDKPAGLVVHPGAGNPTHTLLNALLHHAPQLKELPRAGILHRLDKETSGLLIIAKTEHALKNLIKQLKDRTIVREYQTIANGIIISGGTIDAPIGRHKSQRTQMAINAHGKPARTHYRVMERYRAHTRLKLTLETGRTHQIRVHLASINHPVVGDPTYGGRLRLAKGMSNACINSLRHFKRQALHAYALQLNHPLSNKALKFESPLPSDMENLIISLQKDKQKFT